MSSATASRPRGRTIAIGALVLALAGSVSVAVGQDANWDLLNYHLYNPWAWFDGRLATDLAVAGISTYVNPLLDLPYWLLIDRVPPRVLAFLMGAAQGTNALLLYRIARRVLPTGRRAGADAGLAAFLALAGCMGSVFLSEFGNTMGDNLTAALVLGALLLALGPRDPASTPSPTRAVSSGAASAIAPPSTMRSALDRALMSGLCAGIATGLKLTNAPYAVGLLALLSWPGASKKKPLARAFRYTSGCLVGFVATYGFWGATLWRQFGNPLFPQFNRLFGGALAAQTIVADDKWAPQGFFEGVLFPYVFSAFPLRIHEVPLVDPLWPIVYTLFAAWSLVRVVRIFRPAASAAGLDDRVAQDAMPRLLLFAGIGYLLWMLVFSIGRYLVTIELLLPLLAWLLLHRLFGPRLATFGGIGTISAAALFPLLAGWQTWGSTGFADPPYRVDVPAIADPAHSTVLVLTAPVAWMLPRFPRELAFAGLDIRFPESPAYRERIARIVASRGGPVFAILPAERDPARGGGVARLNRLLTRFDVERDDLACRYVVAIFGHQPGGDTVLDDGAEASACRFHRDFERTPVFDRDADAIAREVAPLGYRIDLARCTVHAATIGTKTNRYRFCPVDVAPTGTAPARR